MANKGSGLAEEPFIFWLDEEPAGLDEEPAGNENRLNVRYDPDACLRMGGVLPKTVKPRSMAESDIQKLILAWLQTKRFFVWRQNTVGVYDADAGRYRASNNKKGISDILGVLPDGRFLAIEVKSAKGQTSPEQDAFIADVNKNGGLAFVARSLDDVKAHLEDYAHGPSRSLPQSAD